MLLPLLITLNAVSSNHALAPPSSSAFLVKSLTNTKEWTPTSLMMMPPRIVGATPTPLLFGADSGRRANGSRKNNHRHRDCITNNNFLMMVRGGGGGEDADDTTTTDDDDDDDDDGDSSDDSDGDESYEYDRTSSSDDETDTDGDDEAEANLSSDVEEDDIATDDENEEEINRPTEEQIENARNSSALTSQSRNFGIATALWASLFFDAILNTAKRSDLFTSGASSSLSTTSVPTALLASGFGLASAASFLLWRDMEIEADAMGAEDGRSDKGDRHLSLSSSANVDDDDDEGDYRREEASKMFASRTRTRLCLHLSLFGALSLGANAGRYFAAEAPFLGMTGVIINAHNVLACAAAVWKEERAKDGLGPTKWLIGLFRGDEEGGMEKKEKSGMSSLIFRVVALGVWARCIQLSKGVLILGTDLLATGAGAGVATESSIAVVDDARRLCLQIASLARLTLVAGVSRTLCVSTGKAGRRIGFGRHPFFNVLSAVLGVGCLSVGGTVLFDAFGPLTSASNASMAVGGGILVVLFGLFAGYNSVSGFLANAKRSVQ